MTVKPKRAVRLGEEILKELSLILMEKIGDPRLKDLTFTGIRLSDDLRIARVYFSLIGGEERITAAKRGLESAKGFFKREIALRMDLRYIPELSFFHDSSYEYGERIERLLQKLPDE